MSRRMMRVTTAVAALAVATALSGCGTSPGTAASYRGEKVTTEQVQDAVTDITKEAPSSNFDGTSAAVFMVLGPQMEQIAKKYGVYSSIDAAKAAFKTVKDPSQSAIRTVQGSMHFSNLRESQQGGPALQKLFKDADVKLNPRYGTWKKGEGPVSQTGNWIKQVAPQEQAR